MITIKTPEEIEIMAEAGRILVRIMKELEKAVKPGITTKELDRLAESLILKSGGECSFKNYKDPESSSTLTYPACLCTSINEQIVHVLPSERVLKEGEIISLDLGIFHKGFHADMAVTVAVGKISPEAEKLISATQQALKKGIEQVKPGRTFGDISYAIQEFIESQGYQVIRELCGHGIGRELHEDPQILNYGKKRTGPELVEGMVFCLEPMTVIGDWQIKQTRDGYGFETIDGFLSAHFEHTIALTKQGYRVLTE